MLVVSGTAARGGSGLAAWSGKEGGWCCSLVPVWLIPHNPAYSPIMAYSAGIIGKVVSVLRRLRPSLWRRSCQAWLRGTGPFRASIHLLSGMSRRTWRGTATPSGY